ncbi:hypothetical protein SISSUDRAFT_1048941 [Sistotremastrum suecicum HHB10207 ss-3]|uniref:Uncharacterized protein n=1 Tax=Sistotremastrum suecicum HHB10207 ss-3 TaxID=1314776 RepID=A0A166C5C2_9AGAM|nr:hypothetical protein SISSUDRAFT_1048941 [Sistotremastrum suecicum HHB10207 ss-3]
MHVLAIVSKINVQPTAASCPDSYRWALNSFGQDPCQLASSIASVCSASPIQLSALSSTESYPIPTNADDLPCQCNMIYYSIISACAACQGGTWGPYEDWFPHCTPQYFSVGSIPVSLPSNISIPSWASITPTGIFSPDAAEAYTNQTSTSSQSTSSSSSPWTSRAEFIMGMIILGICLVILILGFAFFLHLRRRRNSKTRWRPRQLPVNPHHSFNPTTPIPPPSPFILEFIQSLRRPNRDQPEIGSSIPPHDVPSNISRRPLDRWTVLDISFANRTFFPFKTRSSLPPPISPPAHQHQSVVINSEETRRENGRSQDPRTSSITFQTGPPSYHSRYSHQTWGLEEIELEIERMIRWIERDREITEENPPGQPSST